MARARGNQAGGALRRHEPAAGGGGPARLLALVRGHWQIENGLHYVKDVTLGEDRSLIHQGNGPSVMAIPRDTVVSVLHRAGWRRIAERLCYYSGHPREVLALLGIPLAENA